MSVSLLKSRASALEEPGLTPLQSNGCKFKVVVNARDASEDEWDAIKRGETETYVALHMMRLLQLS